MIQITINGVDRTFNSPLTLKDLIEQLSLSITHLAVALNLEVIEKSRLAELILKSGDRVDLLAPTAGG